MSSKNLESWNVLDDAAGVVWREYRYGKNGSATTLAFKGKDGVTVVSPPCDTSEREMDALKELGPVNALIANNVFHNLGQMPWRKHFPDAVSYAPAGAIPKLTKKCPDVAWKPLGDLAQPEHVRCEDPPGTRSGETIVTVKTANGSVWYVGDLLANFEKLPPAPVKWLFSLTGSGPGFKLFKLAAMVLVKDNKRLRAWMLERMNDTAPSVVVPAHGKPVDVSDVADQMKTQVERL